ncbi:hypothetical protein HPHPP74_0908 [Helicobacter pylori Hp P-74]|nr:hypothetical protein HPHPP74_0908 [Helicobacter pylori Hp P-74]
MKLDPLKKGGFFAILSFFFFFQNQNGEFILWHNIRLQ